MTGSELVPIGTFARSARLTVKALRHYHHTGLLVPAHVDPATGYRSYGWDQLADALLITSLRELDMPLERIRRHLVEGVPLRELLASEREDLERRAAKLQRALAVVDTLSADDSFPELPVDTVTWEERTTLAATADMDGDEVGPGASLLIGGLLERSRAAGLTSSTPAIAAYPVTLAGSVRVTAHLVPDRSLPVDPTRLTGATVGILPGGPLARVVHVGAHETLPIAYHSLIRALTAQGQPLAGPIYERYLDDPELTEPSTMRTEVLHRLT